MKTLNRPMFRYGGPIKEGIMDGIREPKQNGGTIAGGNQIGMPMGNRTGFADPIKSAGYFSNLGSKAMNLFNPLKKTRILGGLTKIPKYAKNRKSYYDKIPAMERAGMFVRNNPKTTGALAIGATSDPVIGAGKMIGGGLQGVADFLTPGWVQRALEKDKKTDAIDESKLTADQIEINRLKAELLGKKDDVPIVPKKTEKEIRDEQMSKYEKIMDIKGMKKDAAYNSLIAASQLINSEGDFKGSLKDGSLISKLIASTSKAYDKPANTRDALKSLLAKAEIEKDINLTKGNASTQSITALANASGRSEKYIANAKLQIPNSPGEAVAQLAKLNSGALTSDKVTAVISNYASENGIPFKQQITTEEKLEKVGKGKDYSTVVEFVNDLTLDPGGANDGLYVVGTSVVQVTDGVAKLKG
jgi:hypothetical protein